VVMPERFAASATRDFRSSGKRIVVVGMAVTKDKNTRSL